MVNIKSGIVEFANGIKVIFGKDGNDAAGDKKLARMSQIVIGQIPIYGINSVRRQVIIGIEGDLKRATKKGPEVVEALIQNALNTPDYKKLLWKLGLDEPHIRVLAMQAEKNGKKKGDK